MMKKIVYLVHGFASPDGKGQTDRLRPYFEEFGWEVIEWDYGFKGAAYLHAHNDEIAAELAADMRRRAADDTYIIACGHSNGCWIIKLAADFGAPIRQAIYIAPALNKDTGIASHVEWVHVWHSPFDLALWVAKFLPRSEWGSMGAVGYKGNDTRFLNYNRSTYRIRSLFHLDVFSKKQLDYFAPLFIGEVESRIK